MLPKVSLLQKVPLFTYQRYSNTFQYMFHIQYCYHHPELLCRGQGSHFGQELEDLLSQETGHLQDLQLYHSRQEASDQIASNLKSSWLLVENGGEDDLL